jgi:RNA polymerase sigma-70 factor (ECF subfamily)
MDVAAPGSGAEHAHQLVDHLFRTRAGQMVAWLTRVFGPAHLELAEEVVQDALVKALTQWPYSGVPDNPGGWLFQVARNAALDRLRRHAAFRGRAQEIAAELTRLKDPGGPSEAAIEDDELRMVFMCCHPALPPDARVALSLKTVGGFSVGEIARAFLVAEATIAQRLVRAKRLLRGRRIGLELPYGEDLRPRLESVLEVIYLLFNEGYAAHAGQGLIRLDLCREALRLGRLVAQSPAVAAPAAHALVALMAFQAARLDARVDEAGEMVLLEDQDPARWDRRLVALGFAHFEQCAEGPEESVYHLQAAIAAIHARAQRAEQTRWPDILALYDRLLALNPSPIVALNRAVALSRVAGPAQGLVSLAALETDPTLAHYYLLPSIKGRLLADLGDHARAAECYRHALALPCSEPERRFLARRLDECLQAAGTLRRPGPESGVPRPGADP